MDTDRIPPRVGCTLLPSRLDALDAVRGLVEVVELSPDMYCEEREDADGILRTRLDHRRLRPALDAIGELPVAVHGLELSIGSVHGWNTEYLRLLADLECHVDFAWHSEHLGFLATSHGHAGIPLPLPWTAEAADLVAARATVVRRCYGRPFLLENAVHYIGDLPADPGWDEATFLTAIVERSGCELLLDLFNLHVNAANHGADAHELLDRLPLDAVGEIHVAGGGEAEGFLLDSHDAVVPEPVWDLLDHVLDRASNVRAVVYEVLEQSFERVGIDAYVEQVRRVADACRASGRITPGVAVGA